MKNKWLSYLYATIVCLMGIFWELLIYKYRHTELALSGALELVLFWSLWIYNIHSES